ncbi:MAG: phosphomannomutase/phosphoglucomutase [Planctomycetota bacterium]
MSIFKAYDVRGIYGEQIDETLARKIGIHFARQIGARSLVVGRDMRACAPSIAAAFIEGAREQGADVIDIGLASTPMTYFAIGSLGVDGGVQITASHNPAQYIGMKFCRRDCVPVSYESGIKRLEEECRGPDPAPAERQGSLSREDVTDAYVTHVTAWVGRPISLRCVFDAGNGMAGHELPPVIERLGLASENLYFELDGTFPNHEANPLDEHTLVDVIARVKASGADVGVAFDGDADRCRFVDENGRVVANDILTAIIAREMLARNPGSHVVYDLRSSRVVAEEVERAGGVPVKERVGHSFIKATMRENDACFGGELSGHYYFKDNFTSDNATIAMLIVLDLLQREGRPLSAFVAELERYPATGEVNFEVADKDGMIARLKERYADGRISDLDGVTVEYADWWFNVRKSNTEPLLRLNLEADDRSILEARRAEIVAMLQEG